MNKNELKQLIYVRDLDKLSRLWFRFKYLTIMLLFCLSLIILYFYRLGFKWIF